jgi:HPt (histidine-containing phosphotransfer) domain-containing protein
MRRPPSSATSTSIRPKCWISNSKKWRNIEKLLAAIASGNANEINSLAHNGVGVSANCGIVALVVPLRQLERLGHENQLNGAAAPSAQIDQAFARVKLFLKEHLELVPDLSLKKAASNAPSWVVNFAVVRGGVQRCEMVASWVASRP